MCWSERRPDCGWREKWTPCVDVGGVQNWDVERNGRHVLEWAASVRRPELGWREEWTPVW